MIELYVSPSGDDCAPGTRERPLATLTRARNLLRERRQAQKATVWLRGGRYPLRRTLTFGPRDGNVTYAALPSETPILDGGDAIGGWRVERRNGRAEFVTRAPRYFRQLFVNGGRRPRARLPKVGPDPRRRRFFRIADVPGGRRRDFRLFEPCDAFIAAPGQFESWTNLEDADVVVLHFWTDERMPIAGFDPATRRVRTRLPSLFALVDDWSSRWARYYVENVPEALSEPGEWYLDRGTGTLRYLPLPGETPDGIRAFAPRLEVLVSATRGVRGLVFRGLTFEHAEWVPRGRQRPNKNDPVPARARFASDGQAAWSVAAAVRFAGAARCAVEDCVFRHVGGYALELGPGCRGNRIAGCHLYDLGAGGIRINGADASGPPMRRTGNNTIRGNHIHHAGRVFHAGVGILAMHTFGNAIADNHVHDLLYTGISCGWVWGDGPNVARGNRIEGNHVHDIGFGWLSDMGGIYVLGAQPGTVIRSNRVHDVWAHNYGGWCLCLDEGSAHVLVEHNVAHDCGSAPFNMHYGRDNVVRNNIFAFGAQAVVSLAKADTRPAFVLERNLLLTDTQPVYLGGYGWNVRDPAIVADRNLIWSLRGARALIAAANAPHRKLGRPLRLAEWTGLGQDRHSRVADPRCLDLARRDFTLTARSPARKIGFTVNLQGAVGTTKSTKEAK